MFKQNMKAIKVFVLPLVALLCSIPSWAGDGKKHNPDSVRLAKEIMQDARLDSVNAMAKQLLTQGFNAGSTYSQVWCRDLNTFIELACDVVPAKNVRGALLVFFKLQQPNGEMIDGYVTKDQFNWDDNHAYYSKLAPRHVGFKNTVETDQETSLIQAVYKYIAKTGDKSLLQEKVGKKTVAERIHDMIVYLKKERYNTEYGLLSGATTADWGDVQPLSDDVVDVNADTRWAIDVYDNAMLLIALDDMQKMDIATEDDATLRRSVARNVRKYLWDADRQKFRAHIYVGESPVPGDFNEDQVYYHGGTAVAIEAGLLSRHEIAEANGAMLRDVDLSGMPTIGLTLYPTYPEGWFHGGMAKPYIYQNGGDWTWFGGRMIQQLVRYGLVQQAYLEMKPMIDRVIKNKGFYEWYGQGNVPNGSGNFKGSAGVLYKAIQMLRDWARDKAKQE